MHIREYQEWLETWDRARGWDRVSLSHTLLHAYEEMGEVARLALQWEGYKAAPGSEAWSAELAEELSDVMVFLFKLAYQCGVDMEEALLAGQAKAEGRYPDLTVASAELARYHARQTEMLAWLTDSERDGGSSAAPQGGPSAPDMGG
jgi:NTP pyrophosphatase (non-canonical NTP hydrolase)